MTESLRFVLDTNVLVEAHRRYYAFDIAPCFWRVLLELADRGHIVSIDRVKDELMNSGQEDALNKWALSEFDHWFASTENEEVFCQDRLKIPQNKRLKIPQEERKRASP